jgi:hypothetical protein
MEAPKSSSGIIFKIFPPAHMLANSGMKSKITGTTSLRDF